MKKRFLALFLAMSLMILVSACNNSKDNTPPKEDVTEQEIVVEETVQEDTTSVSDNEIAANEITEDEIDETLPPKTSNILMSAKVKTADVKNGTDTEVIGRRAYIEVKKADFENISMEDFAEFATERVKDSGYNWYSIICDDGTGVCFPASIYYVAEYGELYSDGSISYAYGGYIYQDDGTFEYTEYDD